MAVLLSFSKRMLLSRRSKPDTLVSILRRALVSGDACPEAVLRACEEILGSRLFPHYGSREMALGGAICCPAHKGMHLRENHVIAEIVDDAGSPLPRGEVGELVITTIGMEAMPLIRYRTGDYTRVLPGPCPCGSEVLRLDTVRRREVSGLEALDETLFSLPFVADYRAEKRDGQLCLLVLTCGEGRLPPLDAAVKMRPVSPGDRTLYAGKRKLL